MLGLGLYTKASVEFNRFRQSEDGATAIEYGLIAGLIAIAIITAVTAVGTNLSTTFTNISTKIPAA